MQDIGAFVERRTPEQPEARRFPEVLRGVLAMRGSPCLNWQVACFQQTQDGALRACGVMFKLRLNR